MDIMSSKTSLLFEYAVYAEKMNNVPEKEQRKHMCSRGLNCCLQVMVLLQLTVIDILFLQLTPKTMKIIIKVNRKEVSVQVHRSDVVFSKDVIIVSYFRKSNRTVVKI